MSYYSSYNEGGYWGSYSSSYDPQYVNVTPQNFDTMQEETVTVYAQPETTSVLSDTMPSYFDMSPLNIDPIDQSAYQAINDASQGTPLAKQSGAQKRPSAGSSGGGASSGGAAKPQQQQQQQQQRPFTIQNILPRTGSQQTPYGQNLIAGLNSPLLILGGVGLLAYMLGKSK